LLLPYLIMRIIIYGWKDFSERKNPLILMFLITLLLGFWWPFYIYLTNPDFSTFVAIKESSAWVDRNIRPFYHYWSFPVQSGIWAIMATTALVFPYAKNRINRTENYWFIAGWVWIAVLLLSLFPEKKERYLFPVLIPLSLLTASYFSYLIDAFNKSLQSKSDNILLWINGLLMSLISIAIPVATLFFIKEKGPPGLLYSILLLIGFLGIAFIFIKALIVKKPYWIWQGMVGLVVLSCLLILPVIPKITQSNPDFRSYKELRHREDLKKIPFFFNGEIPGKFIEVVWNSGHEVKEWNPLVYQSLPADPPLIFMSHEQPFIILNPAILVKYEVEILGHFDANLEANRGNAVLSNYVTIIKQRK
jgi:hypothetical protein